MSWFNQFHSRCFKLFLLLVALRLVEWESLEADLLAAAILILILVWGWVSFIPCIAEDFRLNKTKNRKQN